MGGEIAAAGESGGRVLAVLILGAGVAAACGDEGSLEMVV